MPEIYVLRTVFRRRPEAGLWLARPCSAPRMARVAIPAPYDGPRRWNCPPTTLCGEEQTVGDAEVVMLLTSITKWSIWLIAPPCCGPGEAALPSTPLDDLGHNCSSTTSCRTPPSRFTIVQARRRDRALSLGRLLHWLNTCSQENPCPSPRKLPAGLRAHDVTAQLCTAGSLADETQAKSVQAINQLAEYYYSAAAYAKRRSRVEHGRVTTIEWLHHRRNCIQCAIHRGRRSALPRKCHSC